MNAVNGYRAKAWECLSIAETMNDPERRADIGDHLRKLYQPVSNESIPPRLTDLLRRHADRERPALLTSKTHERDNAGVTLGRFRLEKRQDAAGRFRPVFRRGAAIAVSSKPRGASRA